MTHDEFFASIKQGDIAQAYFFMGEEEYIKGRALQALQAKLLPEGLEALNETLLTNPPASDIIAAAETLPMMAERRLVVVRDSALITSGKAAGEADESAKLAAYMDNLPDFTCLVFYCKGMPDGRKKLTQTLNKKATVVKFEPLADQALHKWMASQLKGYGKVITPATAALLAFTAGHELMSLVQELSKLASYAGERQEITREDIEAVTTPSLECTVFQLVDALVARKEAEAFRLLEIMLENGEARIGILAMMARQYRNLLHLRLMQAQGAGEAVITKQLGVPPFAYRRLTQQARAAEPDALREKLDLCVDTDFAIKSGKMREDIALERAILRLCS